jgi:hypothetical protein
MFDRLFGARRPQRREAVKHKIRRALGLKKQVKKKVLKPRQVVVVPVAAQMTEDYVRVERGDSEAAARVGRELRAGDKKGARGGRETKVFVPSAMPGYHKRILFINVGDRAIEAMKAHLTLGTDRPSWASAEGGHYEVRAGVLYLDGCKFAKREQKRSLVKGMYFAPQEPATIESITGKLRKAWCNISRRNVRTILRSLETYQLNKGRRKPATVKTHTVYRNPGVIAIDAFFPSKSIDGWRGDWAMVLCCMDTWSRYSRAYVCGDKRGETVSKALEKFLTELASLGHPPRRILADKGTDLGGWRVKDLMERYRQPKDGKGPMIILAPTGTPVLVIEALNAQYQRRLAVFRTSGLTDDPSAIMTAISDQLNAQPRRARGGLSPVQLLRLTRAQREQVNARSTDRFVASAEGIHGLRPLRVGHRVRRLLMTRKEQEAPGMKFKGFRPKWSKELYRIVNISNARGNKNLKRYDIGTGTRQFRWELQLVQEVDSQVPRGLFTPARDDVVRTGEDWSDLSDPGSD